MPIIALTAHEAKSYRDSCLAGRHGRGDGQALYARCSARSCCAAGWSTPPAQAHGAEDAPPPLDRADALAPHGRSQVDTATVTALKNLRAAGQPDLYSRLVGLFETGSAQATIEIDAALAGGDLAAASARLPQIGRERGQCRGAGLCASGANLEELCNAARRDPRRAIIRGDARRSPLAHRRAVASLSSGERMSESPARPIAIIADDEDLGRLLLAETAVASGLSPLSFGNGVAALEAALVARCRHRAPGCRHARHGRLCGVPAAARRCALRHGTHRHGHGPRGFRGHQPRIRGGRHRFHLQARQLGAAAATPGLHPAQRGRIRAHRAARLFRLADRTAEPAALHR